MFIRTFIRSVHNAVERKVPRFAVVGSGPAGLYSCSALLSRIPGCQLDVIDKSPVPYGLVQFGVAPDHAEMRACANYFETMFDCYEKRIRLFCNVAVGSDISYDALCQNYDGIILAYGASKARELGLKNVSTEFNCFSGSSFVSWYNGSPYARHSPDLSAENAIIIGNGNVAIDCARILLSDPERFRHTDLPDFAFKALLSSKIKNVKIIGRRGPVEASFTIKELRELLNLENAPVDLQIPDEMAEKIRQSFSDPRVLRPKRRILELMLSKRDIQCVETKRCGSILFHHTPEEVTLNSAGNRIQSLRIKNAQTGEMNELPCELLIYAIGFASSHLAGVPIDPNEQLQMRDWARVEEERAAVYATGWCARPGLGVIADTQRNSVLLTDQIKQDWEQGNIPLKANAKPLEELLPPSVLSISWADWKEIDAAEKRIGAEMGKPREKIDVIEFMQKRRSSQSQWFGRAA